MRRHFKQEKGSLNVYEKKSENVGDYKTTNTFKQHMREHFPFGLLLAAKELLEEIKGGKLFGYVQCEFEGPEFLKSEYANLHDIFKKIFVRKKKIADRMKNYAKEENLLSKPQKRLLSSFTLQNGTLVTHLLLIYLHLHFVCTKIHRFLVDSRKKRQQLCAVSCGRKKKK